MGEKNWTEFYNCHSKLVHSEDFERTDYFKDNFFDEIEIDHIELFVTTAKKWWIIRTKFGGVIFNVEVGLNNVNWKVVNGLKIWLFNV